MVDGEHRDHEPAFFEDDRRCGSALRIRECLHSALVAVQQLGAVMIDAVTDVERVGFLEAGHDSFDPRRAEYPERPVAAVDPGHQVEFSEFPDVVGVEVREQHRADPASGDAP
jgi:hypothetical protein